MANNNVPMIDKPFFELLNQLPVATSAAGAMTTSEDGADKSIYYINGANFFAWDCIGDSPRRLASPLAGATTVADLKYTKRRGFHARVIEAGVNTLRVSGLRGGALDRQTVRILQGKSAGEEKVLTFVKENIHEAGVLTATTVNNITDSTKKWQVNQWAGYQLGLTYGTGATVHKNILYNDATTLYIADANLMAHDPWNNQPFFASAPYAVPITTAGAQAHYQIMSSDFTTDSAWDVIPDRTSFLTTLSGGVYVVSSAGPAPFFTFQYYDVLADKFQQKTTPQSLILAALGTDVHLERTGKISATPLYASTGTVSGSPRTISDSAATFDVDAMRNSRVEIVAGLGKGQNRRITSNTATKLFVGKRWAIAPDGTSVFQIWPDYDKVFAAFGGYSALMAYSPENDYWMQGHAFDDGVVVNVGCTMEGWLPFGISSSSSIAAGVEAVNPVPTAGGTNYEVGDVLTCSVGGAGAQVMVMEVGEGGTVTQIELYHTGTTTGYTTGAGKATTGGVGTGCTIEVTSINRTAVLNTTHNHLLTKGTVISFVGALGLAWSPLGVVGTLGKQPILSTPSLTTFCISKGDSITALPAISAAVTNSTTIIGDPTKNWDVNEHVGRVVHLMVAGVTPTSQGRVITANTANSLTVSPAITVAGVASKYVIYDAKVFGSADQRKEDNKGSYGHASGGSTTTLVDSSKNWKVNQWAGYTFKVEAGTGYGSGKIAIISNTKNTLTYSVQTFTPDNETRYEIADTWGVATAGAAGSLTETGTKKWDVNQWAGKRVRIVAGTLMGNEIPLTSNTATALGFATLVPDTSTVYCLLDNAPRGAGSGLVWTWNATKLADKKTIYVPRGGGANQIDAYRIDKDKFDFGLFMSSQSEALNAGSSYAYDSQDGLYFSVSRGANQPINLFRWDLSANKVVGMGAPTFGQGALHVGNYLEVVDSIDGTESWLYVAQNTGTILNRVNLFY